MVSFSLNGKWNMRAANSSEWIPASVPGSVFCDLLAAGKLKDPYWADNMLQAREYAMNDFEYTRTFEVPEDLAACQQIFMRCDGLDTLAEIYLNEQLVAKTDNMHRVWEIEISSFLNRSKNVFRIMFLSPLAYVRRMQKERPVPFPNGAATEGFSHLRKAHSMFGWDSEPEIPDSGIWRDIGLYGFNNARIEQSYFRQNHKDAAVTVTAETAVENWQEGTREAALLLTAPDGSRFEGRAKVEKGRACPAVTIADPQLWWPNGYGAQPLYQAEVVLLEDGQELDREERRIGLRTLEVCREPDEWGESFAFVVNGVPVFAKGGDLIPEDKFIPLARGKREEQMIASCVLANYNCIRVWGGGHFPDDSFFDLCDENGLLVWQDLMFACALYYYSDEFEQNIIAETRDNVIRLRGHPSLAVWCGSNENEWLFDRWDWEKPVQMRTEYIRHYEVVLADVVKQYDRDRLYWPSSPSSGGGFEDPNGGQKGDTHCWTVWHPTTDPYTSYADHASRFVTEFGIQSMPTWKTLEEYIPTEGLKSPNSYLMDFHERNDNIDAGIAKISYYILQDLPYPVTTKEFVYASQVVQGEALQYGAEHWRRQWGNCMGVLYWQINDCWPAPTWASLDYKGRWKAAHYYAKRFYAPVIASAVLKGDAAEIHYINDLPKEMNGKLSWSIRDNDGKTLSQGEQGVTLQPLSSALITSVDLSGLSAADRRRTYLEYSMSAPELEARTRTLLFVKPKHFELRDPALTAAVREESGTVQITVSAKSFARRVALDLKGADCVFSDNYFDIAAGESRTVEILPGTLTAPMTADQIGKTLELMSVYDLGSGR